jgi:NAD(P)-dependent dehydrogenase (short-subunit alcohol dehydrogenase family)
VGSISDNRLGGWHSYRASKAALNQIMRNFAIELGRRNKGALAVSLHPGTVETALSAPFKGNVPDGKLFSADHSAQCLIDVIEGLDAKDSGGFFAWDGQPVPY